MNSCSSQHQDLIGSRTLTQKSCARKACHHQQLFRGIILNLATIKDKHIGILNISSSWCFNCSISALVRVFRTERCSDLHCQAKRLIAASCSLDCIPQNEASRHSLTRFHNPRNHWNHVRLRPLAGLSHQEQRAYPPYRKLFLTFSSSLVGSM